MDQYEKLFAVRGATCCSNTEQDIQEKVHQLYETILRRNNLKENQIVSIQFTVTPDLTALNPAAALRRSGKAQNLALFAAAEPVVEGMLPRTIRMLIHYYGPQDHRVHHVYINGAEILRPDRVC